MRGAPAPPAPATTRLAPGADPAHALLTVARSLLCPANTLATTAPAPTPIDMPLLPIEEVMMPADDVSDLKDVFDAINRLCETMKTSNYSDDEAQPVEFSELVSPREVEVRVLETHRAELVGSVDDGCEIRKDSSVQEAASQFVSAEDLSVQRMETQRQKWKESQASLASSEVSVQREAQPEEKWSDTQISPPSSDVSVAREIRVDRWSDCLVSPPGLTDQDVETITSDTDPAVALCEPISDMYYTASSEVSLLSDTELLQPQGDLLDVLDKEEGKECVIAGHVAAMRERFESMTRANTPCPDSMRSGSPSLDVFRNITPSPDLLG